MSTQKRLPVWALFLGWCVIWPLSAEAGTRRVLIVCGLPGNSEYRAQFATSIDTMRLALIRQWDVKQESIQILFGSRSMQQDGEPVPETCQTPATLDDLQATVSRLKQALQPDDALWVIVMGHAYFDGRHGWLNLAGSDPNELQFAGIFQGLKCRECVFWLTTSVSGLLMRPLAGPGRVLISATDTQAEIESTLFPAVLAKVLDQPPEQKELDLDQNGQVALLDLYLAVCRGVARKYLEEMLLLTEHAQIDDNGDGRGREVQQYYLPEELGGRLRPGAKPALRGGQVDGALAASLPLSLIFPKEPQP
jgi:hypothetical protein